MQLGRKKGCYKPICSTQQMIFSISPEISIGIGSKPNRLKLLRGIELLIAAEEREREIGHRRETGNEGAESETRAKWNMSYVEEEDGDG